MVRTRPLSVWTKLLVYSDCTLVTASSDSLICHISAFAENVFSTPEGDLESLLRSRSSGLSRNLRPPAPANHSSALTRFYPVPHLGPRRNHHIGLLIA
ncbi:hypothetical protein EI94DRAFT_1752427 [Lactarius quietus]|nr:hypothetical protein EI94DRAFT_1752427 [Lactarius quietus]